MTKRFFAPLLIAIGLPILFPVASAAQDAEYTFDNSTVAGNTVADVSGNGYTGTLLSGVTTGQPGKFGQAFAFSGVNSEVQASAPYTFGSSFSISLWMNTADLSQTSYLLLHGTDMSNQNAVIFGYTPSTVEFFGPASVGADPRTGSGITISSANTWNNVIYTYDGTDFRGYLNGSEVFDNVELFSLTASGPLYLGSANQAHPSANYVGSLDDIGIFDRALTSSDVSFLQTHSVSDLSSEFTPEPGTFALLGSLGLAGLGFARRRSRRK